MYLLALGSKTHPIPAASWHAWSRPVRTFDGVSYIDSGAPLFIHQYSHALFDFRGRRDRYADYFINSQWATRANRQFCIDMARDYPWYGPKLCAFHRARPVREEGLGAPRAFSAIMSMMPRSMPITSGLNQPAPGRLGGGHVVAGSAHRLRARRFPGSLKGVSLI